MGVELTGFMLKFLKISRLFISEDAKKEIAKMHRKNKLITNNKVLNNLKAVLTENEMPTMDEIIEERAEEMFDSRVKEKIQKRTPRTMQYGESRMPKSVITDHSYFWPDDDYRKHMHGSSREKVEQMTRELEEKNATLDKRIWEYLKKKD